MLPKVHQARELVRGRDLEVRIQVDGGVSADTIARCAEAGADAFVAGSAVFDAENAADAVAELRRVAEQHQSWVDPS
jgi:ribulose-phosphate 3-epimerase